MGDGQDAEQAFEETLKKPSKWEGHEGLSKDLAQPHGHQQIIAERRPDPISPLPEVPDVEGDGAYLYLAVVYPLIDLKYSLWEYYHSQSDVDLKPKTYVTDYPVIDLFGTPFKTRAEAHRLHWHPDRVAVQDFVDFLRTLVFKQEARQRVWALAPHTIEMTYPQQGCLDRIRCTLLLPYTFKGAFAPLKPDPYRVGRVTPVVAWADEDLAAVFDKWRAVQEERRYAMQADKHYAGPRPETDDAYPYFKAAEIKATAETLWGKS